MSNELAKQISYILYSSPEEDVKVMALVKDETIWLTQKAMAELFDCSTDNISLHLKNVFASGELEKKSVTEEISATASDGKNYRMNFYNLDGNYFRRLPCKFCEGHKVPLCDNRADCCRNRVREGRP